MHPYLYFINTLMIYAYSPYAPPRSVDRLALFICKPDRFLILIAIHCTFHNVTHFMCCTNRNDELSCDISLDFLRFKHNTRYNTPLNRASPQLIEVGASCPAALVKRESMFQLYAYCLMGNHVHLLLREGEEPLGMTFKRIGVSYVYYYNWKYQLHGHLFQDRYRSEQVEDDAYFLDVLRWC